MQRENDPPEPFDSWFEVDVYLQLHDRGFRVIPQYRAANYKIDLVVEGMKGRLAVECDGDEWHGPEEYEKDMARQRILERAKWVFWRIRGSAYYRDPTQALEPLWQKLDELNIKPAASTGNAETGSDQEESPKEEKRSPADDRATAQGTTESGEAEPVTAASDELSKFCQIQDNEKKLTHDMARAIVFRILCEEPSKGKDLLPNDAIKRLGYTCRRADRKKLERKFNMRLLI